MSWDVTFGMFVNMYNSKYLKKRSFREILQEFPNVSVIGKFSDDLNGLLASRFVYGVIYEFGVVAEYPAYIIYHDNPNFKPVIFAVNFDND